MYSVSVVSDLCICVTTVFVYLLHPVNNKYMTSTFLPCPQHVVFISSAWEFLVCRYPGGNFLSQVPACQLVSLLEQAGGLRRGCCTQHPAQVPKASASPCAPPSSPSQTFWMCCPLHSVPRGDSRGLPALS